MIQGSERHPWLDLEPLSGMCPQALTALSLRMSRLQEWWSIAGGLIGRWKMAQSLCECTEWLQLEWLACACCHIQPDTDGPWLENGDLNYPSDWLSTPPELIPVENSSQSHFHLHVASTLTLVFIQCWRLADRKQLQELLYWVTSIKYTRTRHTRQCDGTEYTPQRRKQ